MNSKKGSEEFTQYHKGGSVWAKGQIIGSSPTGYREWFRKDGTIMRSGHFDDGSQVGDWTTYDKHGAVYKITDMKGGKKGSRKTMVERN